MSRITPIEGRQASLLGRLVNWGMRRAVGQEMTPLKIIAHNRGFLLPYLGMSRFVRSKTELPPQIRTLATQLVAELNGCAWCIDFGRYAGQRQNVLAEKLRRVVGYATDPLYSPAERAALGFAEAETRVGARVSDEVFAELRRHFTEREIVELTVAVAAENFYNRVNAALGVEAQGFCALPAIRTERQAA